jgi:hypothetical protein
MLEVRLMVTMLESFIVNQVSKFDFSNFDLRMTNFDTSFANDKRFTIFLSIPRHKASVTRLTLDSVFWILDPGTWTLVYWTL